MTENIKEALAYAVDLASKEEKIITDKDGRQWYDKHVSNLVELKEERYYSSLLNLSTLTSLIEYYNKNVNDILAEKTMIVIKSPTTIEVYTEDDDLKVRTQLIAVNADLPEIKFGSFSSTERFNISLQSKFIDEEDRETLLDYASKLIIENSADLEDDGVSQVTTIKNGVATKAKAKAPNPVTLKPYRTFIEVEQPSSLFIFRVNSQAEMALFEADGGAWVNEAKRTIAEYLKEHLGTKQNVTILA